MKQDFKWIFAISEAQAGKRLRTVGNAVGEGHDDDGEEGWHCLRDVVPLHLGCVQLQDQ